MSKKIFARIAFLGLALTQVAFAADITKITCTDYSDPSNGTLGPTTLVKQGDGTWSLDMERPGLMIFL